MTPSLKSSLIGLLCAAGLPTLAHAQWWRGHPAYTHAMSDLRTAYWMIDRPGRDLAADASEQHALAEIQSAYREMKIASIMDSKDIHDIPPPQMQFADHSGRLHEALSLLREARNDVNQEEEDPHAVGLRQRVLMHLDISIAATAHAINDYHF